MSTSYGILMSKREVSTDFTNSGSTYALLAATSSTQYAVSRVIINNTAGSEVTVYWAASVEANGTSIKDITSTTGTGYGIAITIAAGASFVWEKTCDSSSIDLSAQGQSMQFKCATAGVYVIICGASKTT